RDRRRSHAWRPLRLGRSRSAGPDRCCRRRRARPQGRGRARRSSLRDRRSAVLITRKGGSAMARAQGARAQLALAFESVYGTPPTPPAFWRMPFASSTLGSERPLLASELLGYGRDPLPPVPDVETGDGDIVVPIDLRAWGVWLKAAFGAPNTTGT